MTKFVKILTEKGGKAVLIEFRVANFRSVKEEQIKK